MSRGIISWYIVLGLRGIVTDDDIVTNSLLNGKKRNMSETLFRKRMNADRITLRQTTDTAIPESNNFSANFLLHLYR